MTKKRIIVLSGVGLAVIGIGFLIFGPKKQTITYDTAKAEKGTLMQTVEATGAVTSSQDVQLKFEVSGRIKSINKRVGDSVKAGQVLAQIDNRDAATALQRANAALLAARASVDKLIHGATKEELDVTRATVVSASSSLSVAQSALSDAQQGVVDAQASNEAALAGAYASQSGALETASLKSTSAMQVLALNAFDAQGNRYSDISPSDANQAQQAASDFKTASVATYKMMSDMAMMRATTDRTTVDSLSSAVISDVNVIRNAVEMTNMMMQGAIPSGTTLTDLANRQSAIKTAWNDVVTAYNAAVNAHQAVASAKASATSALNVAQSRVNSATQNVSLSQANLASAQATLALKEAAASPYDIEKVRGQYEQVKAEADAAQVAFDKTRLVAPFDGTVSQIVGKVGDTVNPAQIVMQIHGDDTYEIEADVPETDVAKLAVGMQGTTTLDAYGHDVEFAITLNSIDTAETVIQDIVYYKTRFLMSSSSTPVRAGMTANVSVVALKKDNVLLVPSRAIHEGANGGKIVRILKNNNLQDVAVTVGTRGDGNLTEVSGDISPGTEIVLVKRVNGKIQ